MLVIFLMKFSSKLKMKRLRLKLLYMSKACFDNNFARPMFSEVCCLTFGFLTHLLTVLYSTTKE
jgi:hypothetical protein